MTATGKAIVIQHDAAHLPLPDGSVDLIVTSPPYFGLRDYKDGGKSLAGQVGSEATPAEFLAALWACSSEWWRILADGGSLWVNLGDKYGGSNASKPHTGSVTHGSTNRTGVRGTAAPGRPKSLLGLPWRYAIGMTDGMGDPDGTGWILRAEVVWAKPNGLPESVKDRVARKHEQWFHFTKAGKYYANLDSIREPMATQDKSNPNYRANGKSDSRKARPGAKTAPSDSGMWTGSKLGKLPGSVWSVATEPLKVPEDLAVQHFAAFPTEFPYRIITGWAPTHGICDTCGQGLTATREAVGRERVHWEGTTQKREGNVHKHGATSIMATGEQNIYKATGYKCACEKTGTTHQPVILDPFGGTGTVAAVAKALGCIGISNDLSADYNRLAQWRTNGAGYEKIAAKVATKQAQRHNPTA